MASQDILGDQVNLQYQIFNLRLIMDRSLSDRIQGKHSKLQAVLGIPISLDPSRQALDSAAIVKGKKAFFQERKTRLIRGMRGVMSR